MQKIDKQWLMQLIDLLIMEQQANNSMVFGMSQKDKLAIQVTLSAIADRKKAYQLHELNAVWELIQKPIHEERLFNSLEVGRKYVISKQKVIKRMAKTSYVKDDSFNDFLELIALFIIDKNLAFNTLISSLLFGQKIATLTYTEEEITIETTIITNKKGNNDG